MTTEKRFDGTIALIFNEHEWNAYNPRMRVFLPVETAEEIIGFLDGYCNALEAIDRKLLARGENDERWPKALQMVRRTKKRLAEACNAVRAGAAIGGDKP